MEVIDIPEVDEYQERLKERLIQLLQDQGFKINPHLRPSVHEKTAYRKIQEVSRIEQVSLHKRFLRDAVKTVKAYIRNGTEINPERISLTLKEVVSGSLEEVLFKWWNLIWWSIPYQRSYGRQMRFMLWDTWHDAPFGLICLTSPVFKMSVRDRYLEIPKENHDIWVNMSMNAQRVGALPPYNYLLGGKMVALALTCNEIREAYGKKYQNTITILRKRKLRPELLFITTTSAFGRSSLYNRLKYNGQKVALSLGYTQGCGTFHFPEEIYLELLKFLSEKGVNTARYYGHGPSRKIRLVKRGLRYLGLSKYIYHGIKREFYLFPLVKNLKEVIHKGENPIWVDHPFCSLAVYWKERWALPRALRVPLWKNFDGNKFLKETEDILRHLD